MTDDRVVVVVYCDGTPGSHRGGRTPAKPHAEHPLAAYQLISDGWMTMQYGTFNAIEFRAAQSRPDQMASDGPVQRPTVNRGGREYFDVDAYIIREQELQRRRDSGEQVRPHYQWECDVCGFDVDVNAEPMHQLFRIFAAADGKGSLAQVQQYKEDDAKLR